MAVQKTTSVKRIKVDKAKARIVIITASACFLIVFFLVASFALFSQLTYQNRVIGVKKTAVKQLKSNLTARDSLVASYKTFADAPINLIGGNADGSGPQDGGNAKLVLDALPSKYDFPALTASLEKLLTDHQVEIQGITGVDDEVAQSTVATDGVAAPVEIPIELTVDGSYINLQGVVSALEHSIRPFQFTTLHISGDQESLNLSLTAKTYYQPETTLNIKTETVK